MPLTSLPPEILYSIFEFAGISESKPKLDWLIVSKRLSRIALPFILKDVTLSDRGLRAFSTLLSQDGGGSYIIPSRVKWLSVFLKGYQEPFQLDDSPNSKQPYWSLETTWVEDTMKNLQILANSLHQFTALESFKLIVARKFNSAVIKSPFEPVRDYLYYQPTFSMLNNIPTNRLCDLTIDTCGSSLLSGTDPDASEEQHICPLISGYLPTIRRARIRMRRICPDIFGLSNTNTAVAADAGGPQTIVINLSLYAPNDYLFTTRLSGHCGLSGPCSHNMLVVQMVEAGTEYVRSKPGAEVIIVSRRNGLELQSINCLTGQETGLEYPHEWLTCGTLHDG